MTVHVTHVSQAKIYGLNDLVEGAIAQRFNVFKLSAGIDEDIVSGYNATAKSPINQILPRIFFSRYVLLQTKTPFPPRFLSFSRTSTIPPSTMENCALNFMPITLKPSLLDSFARSMKALIFSKVKDPLDLMEVLAIVSEDEIGQATKIISKALAALSTSGVTGTSIDHRPNDKAKPRRYHSRDASKSLPWVQAVGLCKKRANC
ncbi:hypothetical protein BDR26DRAFT_940943 [Obelidium mucronatum]|nr:hypothetical protein BDR26DRAFT_940943 [Obelidium mucronatum]